MSRAVFLTRQKAKLAAGIGLHAAYFTLKLQYSAIGSSAFPLSSANRLSEASSPTHREVCLCAKNSTTIYCNQTVCIGRVTWGAPCALPPRREIAVDTFPPPFSVGRPRRAGSFCPLSAPPPTERNATPRSQLHIYYPRLMQWRKWLLFSFYGASLILVPRCLLFLPPSLALGWSRGKPTPEANWLCSILLWFARKLERRIPWIEIWLLCRRLCCC